MNRSNRSLVFALLATAVCLGCSDDDDDGPASASLTLLYTSDEHSRWFAFAPELDDFPAATSPGTGTLVGGVARRATVLADERARAEAQGSAVLLLSAGDNTMGALPHIGFETDGFDYQMMAALGYDVTTLGNHEFDFGPNATANSISAASGAGPIPAIVASNLHFDDADGRDDALAALHGEGAPIQPFHVLATPNGITVGFVGFLGADAADVAPNKAPVRFSAPTDELEEDADQYLPLLYADVQPLVDRLRGELGADFVVGLSHAGVSDKTGGTIELSEDYRICQNVAGLDAIISGHAHNGDAPPIVVQNTAGGTCTVLNASAYGRHLGRADFTVYPGSDQAPELQADAAALLPVDDERIPDSAFVAELDSFVAAIEAAGDGSTSYLENLISRVEETTVTNDPNTVGDLYFHIVGHTDFDVTDTQMLNFLSADAMLAASDAVGIHTDFALESAGVVRSDILHGQTGDIAVADAFAVVPLGNSPVDGSVGYPLTRGYVVPFELRATFELAAFEGPTNSDFQLGQAGVRVTYDKSRPPIEDVVDMADPAKGWVMKIEIDSDHADGFEQYDTVIYDRDLGINSTDLVSGVISTYVAQFASSVGVTLKDANGQPISIIDGMLHRTDQSEVKQLEAFMSFLKAAPGGTLPELYDAGSANRTGREICLAGCDR